MTATLKEEIQGLDALGGVFLDIDQKYQHADFTKPLTDLLPILEESHARHWSGRMTPAGSQWPPLAASTIARKGHDRPLVLTGALQAAMTNRNDPNHVGGVTHRGLIYGTDLEYAPFHQDGTRRIPQREFAGMDEDTCQKAIDMIAEHLVRSLMYTIRG